MKLFPAKVPWMLRYQEAKDSPTLPYISRQLLITKGNVARSYYYHLTGSPNRFIIYKLKVHKTVFFVNNILGKWHKFGVLTSFNVTNFVTNSGSKWTYLTYCILLFFAWIWRSLFPQEVQQYGFPSQTLEGSFKNLILLFNIPINQLGLHWAYFLNLEFLDLP